MNFYNSQRKIRRMIDKTVDQNKTLSKFTKKIADFEEDFKNVEIKYCEYTDENKKEREFIQKIKASYEEKCTILRTTVDEIQELEYFIKNIKLKNAELTTHSLDEHIAKLTIESKTKQIENITKNITNVYIHPPSISTYELEGVIRQDSTLETFHLNKQKLNDSEVAERLWKLSKSERNVNWKEILN